jgi:PDZ domain-containing secreted protein
VVESVTEPAASAGVRKGDILFAVGDVDLYSQDDLDDVLRASRPGEEVVLAVKRGGEEVRKVAVRLGFEAGPGTAGIAWRYASLANLPRARQEARAGKKNVLVGLSGAET